MDKTNKFLEEIKAKGAPFNSIKERIKAFWVGNKDKDWISKQNGTVSTTKDTDKK